MRRASLFCALALGALAGRGQAQVPQKGAVPTRPVAPAPAAPVRTAPAAPAQTAPAAAVPATAAADPTADTAGIKQLLETFTTAYNAGDAPGVAATYTPDALVIDEDGNRTEGRDGIAAQYAETFAERPGSKIALRVDALKFLGPQTAMEQGRAVITPPEGQGAAETSRFTAIYVKHDGHWLQAVVRDETETATSPHDRLKDLEWLVGEWVNESQDAVVHTTCKWTEDGNFLVREFTMRTRGTPVLSGTQRIGWDPVRKQFKMWVFDSEGGFGEGYLSHSGDQWIVKAEGTRQDGQHASATTILTRLGKDRIGWQATDRTLGDLALPGIDEFVIVRKPPDLEK